MIALPSGAAVSPTTRPRPPRRIERYVILALLPSAVAIAVALVALRLRFQPPTLAPYVIEGDPSEAVIVPGGRYAIVARPTSPSRGAVGARAFLVRGDSVRPWDPAFVVRADGAVRIEGPTDVLFAGVPAGPWEVAIAIGRPEVLPTAPNDVLRARHAEDADPPRPAVQAMKGPTTPRHGSSEEPPAGSWYLVVQPVRIEPAAPRGMPAP